MSEKRTATKVSAWEPPDGGRKRWYVTFEDGSEALTWDSKVAEAIPIGKETSYDLAPPKQEGWKPSITWLPDVLGQKPARGSGGGGGRPPRDETFIQERMDRRTALMQAVIMGPQLNIQGQLLSAVDTLALGDALYAWLRQPIQATETPSSPDRAGETPARSLDTPEPRPTTSEPPVAEAPSGKAAQGPAGGEGDGEAPSPPVPEIDPTEDAVFQSGPFRGQAYSVVAREKPAEFRKLIEFMTSRQRRIAEKQLEKVGA